MNIVHIIIDRIDKTVVFNIVENIPLKYTHMRSIIDDDLIAEYLHEMDRFSRISNTSDASPDLEYSNIQSGMKQIGEAMYKQLIPEAMQVFLNMQGSGSLFFHIDASLRMIPWELLHDGHHFLAQKFYIGRNINGLWRPQEIQEFERLNVLIIADPAENLEWAHKEGEQLYESLIAEVSPDRLDLQYLAGRRATKLRILNALEGKQVIHYAGHVYQDLSNPEESGWVLGDNKILRSREIKKSGTAPLLVFSNSCVSSPLIPKNNDDKNVSDLATAFLYSGIGNYIGTNWEIKDNKQSSDFALKFYKDIFDEKSVGAALLGARKLVSQEHGADLTWANYVLHGNPDTVIYRSGRRRSFDASRLPGYLEKVIGTHPLPIARSYEKFLLISQNSPDDAYSILKSLCSIFENTMIVAGAIVFASIDQQDISQNSQVLKSNGLRHWCEHIFDGIDYLYKNTTTNLINRFIDGLNIHKENIYKLIAWFEMFAKNLPEKNIQDDSYLIGFQFYLDNLLSDIFLSSNDLLIYPNNDEETLVLNGNRIRSLSGREINYLKSGIEKELYSRMNEICYLQKKDNVLFSLHPYIQYDHHSGEVYWPELFMGTSKNKNI